MAAASNSGSSGGDASIAGGSPDRFGYEWATYTEVKPEYEELFRRWLPFYKPEDWRGKTFMDVGCGMGRNSYWPMSYGAAASTSIDVDDRSLASARQSLAPFKTSEVRKVSAYEIDARDAYDIVFSIGVIHHLEWPEKALQGMVQAAKPGGDVAIWVYGRENNGWFLWALNPLRKLLFSWMPLGMLHVISNIPTAMLWVLLRVGLNQIEYFRLMRKMTYKTLRLAVFDQMLPRISNYWRRDEVEALMKARGLEKIELAWVNEMSWAARGVKPKQAS